MTGPKLSGPWITRQEGPDHTLRTEDPGCSGDNRDDVAECQELV